MFKYSMKQLIKEGIIYKSKKIYTTDPRFTFHNLLIFAISHSVCPKPSRPSIMIVGKARSLP